ncbi:Uncharacterised protein [Mycobacteroides abscessus subsp. abscessus]|nr:Uncharacterised protein [Mycobacteroides abscessus subsp. abscessus]
MAEPSPTLKALNRLSYPKIDTDPVLLLPLVST